MPNTIGTQIARSLDYIVCKTAAITFNTIQYFNKRNPNPSVMYVKFTFCSTYSLGS
jgi:hypothetical protein